MPTNRTDASVDALGRSYRVGTGLFEYVVEATDRASAIEAFRRKLCSEMPRLWDVIQEITDDRFAVSLADEVNGEPTDRNHEAA